MHYPGISLDGMLQGYRDQYLTKTGWVRSVELRTAVDEHGDPVPWLTYPATAFLTRVLKPEWKVFEFGGGSSTAWWSRRVAEIHSVDHDADWQRRIQAQCGTNADLRLVPAGTSHQGPGSAMLDRYFAEVVEPPVAGDKDFQLRAGLLSEPFRAYAAEILRFSPEHFDVVVIDGMARSLTTWLTIQQARPKSFIVFDNSDREAYAPIFALLKQSGYHRIDFWGTGPINPYEWCTSVFLRNVSALP